MMFIYIWSKQTAVFLNAVFLISLWGKVLFIRNRKVELGLMICLCFFDGNNIKDGDKINFRRKVANIF